MLKPPTTFEVRRQHTFFVSSVIGLVTLTFDLLTSNPVRVIARQVGNLPTNFDISGTFCS